MNKLFVAIGLVFIVVFHTSCKKEFCEQCVKCISYDSEQTLINEARECNQDTSYLEGYKAGFILGANEKGREAICFDLGVVCE